MATLKRQSESEEPDIAVDCNLRSATALRTNLRDLGHAYPAGTDEGIMGSVLVEVKSRDTQRRRHTSPDFPHLRFIQA